MENIVRLIDYKNSGCPNCHRKVTNLDNKTEYLANGLKFVCPFCGMDLHIFSDKAISERLSHGLKMIINDIEGLAILNSRLDIFRQIYDLNYHAIDFQIVINFIANSDLKPTELDEILMGHLTMPEQMVEVIVPEPLVFENTTTFLLPLANAQMVLTMLNRINYSFFKQNSKPSFSYTKNRIDDNVAISIYFMDCENNEIFAKLLNQNGNILNENIIRAALSKETSLLNTLKREKIA